MDEEMGDNDLGGLDIVRLEDTCKNKTFQNIAPNQIELLTNILHSIKANNKLGVVTTTPKHIKKNTKDTKKRVRKNALQRITNLGAKLVESVQYSQLQLNSSPSTSLLLNEANILEY